MSNTDQNDGWDDANETTKKRGMPRWLFWCGGGCLLMLLLLAALAMFAFDAIEDAMDPDVIYAEIEEEIPMDSRLEGYTGFDGSPFIGLFTDMKVFAFMNEHDQKMAIFFFMPPEDGKEFEKMFDPDFAGEVMGARNSTGMQKVDIEIQGRPVRAISLIQEPAFSFGAGGNAGASSCIIMDLTPEDEAETTRHFLMYYHLNTTDAIEQEAVQGFLQPFHIGPKR